MTHSTVIRMGAAHWDCTVTPTNGGPLHFDFRAMSKDERRQFHATFMASYRKTHPMYANQKPRRPHRRRKARRAA